MLTITETASTELQKILSSDQGKGKELVIVFQGYGWSGPSLGMALEESTDGMKPFSSNGVTAYIDSELIDGLTKLGKIVIDYFNPQFGRPGYKITVGDPKDCGDCSC